MANGATRAVQLATKLGEVNFPEFTESLITSTFEALLKAHIQQLDTYADILDDIAMTLSDYIETYRNTVSDEEIDEWFEDHGLPIIKKDADTQGLSEDDIQALKDMFLKQPPEDLNTSQDQNQDQDQDQDQNQDQNQNQNQNTYTLHSQDGENNRIGGNTIRERVVEMILTRRQNLLKELVKMGLVRLVVDFGEIETRLLFSVYGVSTETRTTYESTSKTREGSIGGRIQAKRKIKKKLFASGFLGGYYSGGSVRVRTTSAYDRDTTGSRVDIFGRVYIRFKSDYAPLKLPEEE